MTTYFEHNAKQPERQIVEAPFEPDRDYVAQLQREAARRPAPEPYVAPAADTVDWAVP